MWKPNHVSSFFCFCAPQKPIERRNSPSINNPPHSPSLFIPNPHFKILIIMACENDKKGHLLLALGLVLCVTLTFFPRVTEGRVPFACDPRNGLTRGFKFCNTHVPIHVRVQDLIARLTLPEKIRLVVNNAIAVPRLGIQGYEWWSEALHGVSNVGPGTKFGGAFPGATMFPQVISTAASFNQSLWQEIGRVRFCFSLCLHTSYHNYELITSTFSASTFCWLINNFKKKKQIPWFSFSAIHDKIMHLSIQLYIHNN